MFLSMFKNLYDFLSQKVDFKIQKSYLGKVFYYIKRPDSYFKMQKMKFSSNQKYENCRYLYLNV